MKTETIDIKNCSGDDFATLMAKGHHEKEAFKAAAFSYWGEPLLGFDEPAHFLWRWVPCRPGDDYKGYYHEAQPNSRGAFACTAMTQW